MTFGIVINQKQSYMQGGNQDVSNTKGHNMKCEAHFHFNQVSNTDSVSQKASHFKI